jgi:hypothetical protein
LKRLNPIILPLLILLLTKSAHGQYNGFSVSTDLSLLRSFQKNQQFNTFGNCIRFISHATSQDGFYAWLSFYGSKDVYAVAEATAKDPSTQPQTLAFTNRSSIRIRNISLGWTHYFVRTMKEESQTFGLYGQAGFGLIFGRVKNLFMDGVDTAFYNTALRPGSSGFKRLTLDLGLGAEKNLGSDIFLFLECRSYIPASSYENPYLFVNKNAPLTGSLHAGLRVYFD